jgi:outer membrane protein
MNTHCRKILIMLLVCALPTLAGATDNVPAPSVPTPVPAAAPKLSIAPTLQPPAPTAPSKATEACSATQIGYVDLVRIGSESEPGKEGLAKLSERQKKLKGQLEAKRKYLDKQRAAIEAKLSSLSPQQREAKGKEFGKKVEEFQKFGQNAEEQLQKLLQELSSSLYKKVEQTANEYGKANGFTAIFVKRDLLYAADGVDVKDVTDQVTKLLNEKGQKK